ncbi:MAG: hypothetical protein AAFX87_26130 [Bacteroidota bacterium]
MKKLLLTLPFTLFIFLGACQKECNENFEKVKGNIDYAIRYRLDREYNFVESQRLNYNENNLVASIDSKVYYRGTHEWDHLGLPDSLIKQYGEQRLGWLPPIRLVTKKSYNKEGKLIKTQDYYHDNLVKEVTLAYQTGGWIHQTHHEILSDERTYSRYTLNSKCQTDRYQTLDSLGNLIRESNLDQFHLEELETDGYGNVTQEVFIEDHEELGKLIHNRFFVHHIYEDVRRIESVDKLAGKLLSYLKVKDYQSITDELLGHRFNYLELFDHIGGGKEAYFESKKVDLLQQYQISRIKEDLSKRSARGFDWAKASIKEIDKNLRDEDGIKTARCDFIFTDGQKEVKLSYLQLVEFVDGWRLVFVK